MPKKTTLSEAIKIRITPQDKQTIYDYCAEMGIQVSDFIRFTILKTIKEAQNK